MTSAIGKALMDKTTTAVSYATSGTVGFGGLLSSDWVMVYVGVFFALLTFLVNWWYQKRRETKEDEARLAHQAREKEYHDARMALINKSDK